MSTGILWLRRDLRLTDQPALWEALRRHERVVTVFCFDDRLLGGRHASGARTQFLLESLADLDESLRERGGALVVRRGRPEVELIELARSCGAEGIHLSADVTPFAARRDRRVRDACAAAGIGFQRHPGLFAVDDVLALRTQGGTPFKVFSPFHRRWLAAPRRAVQAVPAAIPLHPDVDTGVLPELAELGLRQEISRPLRGGERPARELWRRFEAEAAGAYGDEGHDDLGREGTSRLSPYLRFGCISPRELEGGASEPFRRQLAWREFYAQLLGHHPQLQRLEFQERLRELPWREPGADFERWTEGRTGYPLVDAGMRQLCSEGWMHNRARLVVGSFLTKHLGIDWRLGEAWFMRLLLDGDPASNNGNWQWIASVGTDPQPVARRLLNPTRQQQRFDPRGSYVRRHVPELAGVPDDALAEPWLMDRERQLACGCEIGVDYPRPIVDHAQARREALARYAR
ncbi:MAG: deoxyribodipyrimidine photo-lyase [Solirubrobacteraceae bacterium]